MRRKAAEPHLEDCGIYRKRWWANVSCTANFGSTPIGTIGLPTNAATLSLRAEPLVALTNFGLCSRCVLPALRIYTGPVTIASTRS